VVQQVLKKEPCGIHCLMFSSLQQQQAQQLLQQKEKQQQQHHQHHRRSGSFQQQQQQQQQQQRQRHHHSNQLLEQQQQQQQQWWLAGIVRACRRLDAWLGSSSQAWMGLTSPHNHHSSSGSSSSWGVGAALWRPVLLDVAGGYTISGLDGFADEESPESLVTCILKVRS
jgi:hypothetical protein